MMRRLLYRSLDLAFPAIADPFWRARVRGTVRCLLYHRVGRVGEFPFLDEHGGAVVEADQLRRDIQFMARQGARFLTFSDLRRGVFPGKREFGVVVSFDDGTRDVYERGLPVLDALGVPAVIFQIAGLVDAPSLIWEHALYRIWSEGSARRAFLDAYEINDGQFRDASPGQQMDQLRAAGPTAAFRAARDATVSKGLLGDESALAMRLNPSAEMLQAAAATGHEIGSHGYSHVMRAALDHAEFERELATSKEKLEGILRRPVLAYSHPFNSYVRGESEATSAYFAQVARVDGEPILNSSDPMDLPRFNWPGRLPNSLRWRRWLWTGG